MPLSAFLFIKILYINQSSQLKTTCQVENGRFFIKTGIHTALSHNVLLMRSRGSLFAAIWRSPNDRQGVKRICFESVTKIKINLQKHKMYKTSISFYERTMI